MTKEIRVHIPVVLNLQLAAMFVVLQLFLYFLLPWWLLPQSQWWGILVIPIALATTSYWALAHEAIHAVLHPRRRLNNGLGRLLAIFFGTPFAILRFGHLLHHRASRTDLDRSEVYDPRKQSRASATAEYYFHILGGLYYTELSTVLLVFLPSPLLQRMVRAYLHHDRVDLPDMGEAAVQKLLSGNRLWQLRLDAVIILLLFASSFLLYGTSWYWLVLALALRGLLIAFYDNAYHYGTPLERIRESYNLALPPFASRLILHFNLHHVHHRHPSLPWTQLPAVYKDENDHCEGGYLAVAFRQLGGPIPLNILLAKKI